MTYSLLAFEGLPILEQLQLEEALLRSSQDNWCLINSGSPPAIVMGISGKPERLLDVARVKEDQIPLIKRFSGGGTVYIDPHTIFVTLISNGKSSPKEIMEFSKTLYAPLFPHHFDLRENDYVLGEKKFGGNAQYIQKERWLHHTSFLWNFEPEKMNYLTLPEKRPLYRNDRPHQDFLCSLSAHFECKTLFIQQLKSHLKSFLGAEEQTIDLQELLKRPHRKATINISQDL